MVKAQGVEGVGEGMKKTLMDFYCALYEHFGPQGWWPGRTRFEIIVGAVLTQNTNWTNVEKAIGNLKREGLLTPQKLRALDEKKLAGLIRPAGYFNVKARRLKNFLDFLFADHKGRLNSLFKGSTETIRQALLSVSGIGPETADSIMLYAAKREIFVIDAYTKRLLFRHGLIDGTATRVTTYGEMQRLFTDNLTPDVEVFNEYHALIVMTGQLYCRPKSPRCHECPLGQFL